MIPFNFKTIILIHSCSWRAIVNKCPKNFDFLVHFYHCELSLTYVVHMNRKTMVLRIWLTEIRVLTGKWRFTGTALDQIENEKVHNSEVCSHSSFTVQHKNVNYKFFKIKKYWKDKTDLFPEFKLHFSIMLKMKLFKSYLKNENFVSGSCY